MNAPIIGILSEWCDAHFCGVLSTREPYKNYDNIRHHHIIVGFDLIDKDYPFGNDPQCIARVQLTGTNVEVRSWCKRYSTKSSSIDIKHNESKLVVDLADPNSVPIILEELFQISFDYCRVLYRQSIKRKRKYLKPIVMEMMDTFRQERNKCRETDYAMDVTA